MRCGIRYLFHMYIGLPVTEANMTVFRITWKLFIVAKAKQFDPVANDTETVLPAGPVPHVHRAARHRG